MSVRWVTGLVLLAGLALAGCTEPERTSGPSNESDEHIVVYSIKGTLAPDGLRITMRNDTGGTDQLDGRIPFRRSYVMRSGDFAYISGQVQGGFGNPQCEITSDGVVIASSSSSGRYAITTCSGSVP